MYTFAKYIYIIFTSLLYPVEVKGLENIPKEGPVILAGNHLSNVDGIFMMRKVPRQVHFIIKKELVEGIFGWIFKAVGFIPVDRNSNNNKEGLDKATELLENNEVIGIFPEGTFNKSEYVILPFKMGACYLANKTNAYIVPFSIGKVRMFHKTKIVFGKSYQIKDKDDLRKENITLMNKVINLLYESN